MRFVGRESVFRRYDSNCLRLTFPSVPSYDHHLVCQIETKTVNDVVLVLTRKFPNLGINNFFRLWDVMSQYLSLYSIFFTSMICTLIISVSYL